MHTLPTLTHTPISETARLHQQANDLLSRLLVDREAIDQRLAAAGKRDPIKIVTGETALDKAITATREMIAEMDLLLSDLDCGTDGEHVAPVHFLAPQVVRPAAAAFRQRPGGKLIGQRPVAATA